jgi:hypothetical protein
MEFVPVTTVNDTGLANVVRGVLEQAGIETMLGGTGMEDIYPMPSVNPLHILVSEDDLDRARDVLAQFDTMTDDDADDE